MEKLILHWPLHPTYITQTFAENSACIRLDLKGGVIPCDGFNPPKGYRSVYADNKHGALDLKAYHGQPVYAATKGVVYHIDTSKRSGLDVRIETEVGGKKYRHIYEHLLDYKVKVGQTVEVGQQIGRADNTGYSAGDHLHFQLEEYKNGRWVKIDPFPYMSEINAPTALLFNYKILYLKQRLAQLMESAADSLRP